MQARPQFKAAGQVLNLAPSLFGQLKKLTGIGGFCLGGLLSMPSLVHAVEATNQVAASSTNLADLPLEQLTQIEVASVYGASKYEQKVTEAPASVSIVTADEIKKFGYRTLADVLQSMPGVFVANDRNYQYLGVRGFLRPGDYNTRVLLLVDGHRVNENIYDAIYLGQDAIDVDVIDRVEFIRGPSSSIYGSSAFFGVINVITKRGSQYNGVQVSGEGGSFNTYKTELTYGKKYENDLEVLVEGSYYTSDGQLWLYYPEFDQRISTEPRAANNGWAKHVDGEEAYKLFTSFGYHDFSLEGFVSRRTKHIPTASFLTVFDDGREQTIDTRAYADLKYEHNFSPDQKLMARIFYDACLYRGDYPFEGDYPSLPGDGTYLNKDDASGQWAGAEVQFNSTLFDQHRIILGGEFRDNFRQEQYNYDDIPQRVYYTEDDHTSQILGVFGQAEINILSNLTLNAGVRYDHYFQNFGDQVNPRVGLVYNPWTSGAFKLLYGEAFRAPSAFERYYYSLDERAMAVNTDLKPETIRTYELVYEQYFARHYRFSLSGYYYDINDLITQTIDAYDEIIFANMEQARAKGVEFQLEGKYPNGWMARASYALQRAENEDTGAELSNSPRHLAKFNLLAPLYMDKLFAGPEVQYHSIVKTLGRHKASDFTLVNFTLFSQNWVKGLEISASIYNLLDTEYGYPGSEDHLQDIITQDGRSFRIKVTYRF